MSPETFAAIHPTAIVDPGAVIADDAQVGPHAIVGPQVTVGAGAVVGPGAILERNVRLGARCRVGPGSVLGGDPQDLKWRGEETWVEIGDDTVIREFTTVNRGTAESGSTTVGKGCLLMSYVHLAHDCHIADGVILSNNAQLAGHVHVDEKAIIGGMTGVHQFVHIGAHAFVGGFSKIAKDVPPFTKVDGNPPKLYGLNLVGLQRHDFPRDTLEALKLAYRLFFRSSHNVSQALAAAHTLPADPAVERFVAFIRESERGILM